VPVAIQASHTSPAAILNGPWQARRSGATVKERYALRDRLGAGATACVYRARDRRLERDVAVKVLHPHLTGDPELVERFRREARCAARLNGEHLAPVYDLGSSAGTHFMAMEYVAGRSLKSIIREEAPIEPSRALDLGMQLLKAARSMHDRGIVHRDLKPANAIVDSEGHLKVIDLGIARANGSELTTTGSILATARYASPEQALGRGVTAASDLYSIGVILYELLAGRPPFEGDGAVALALKHVHERPPSLAALRPALAPGLASTVMRSLHKDPAHRFADADEFIAALHAARLVR
jgi:serine/threonine protein kinase